MFFVAQDRFVLSTSTLRLNRMMSASRPEGRLAMPERRSIEVGFYQRYLVIPGVYQCFVRRYAVKI